MNNESRNIVLAIVACVGFYLAFNSYMGQKYPQQSKPVPSQSQSGAPAEQASPDQKTSEPNAPQLSAAEFTDSFTRLEASQLEFDGTDLKLKLNQDNSSIQSVELKNYRQSNTAESAPLQLIESGLSVQGYVGKRDAPVIGFNGTKTEDGLSFSRTEGNWLITQSFKIPPSGYVIDVNVNFKNVSDRAQDLVAGVLLRENIQPSKAGGGFFSAPSLQHASLVKDDSAGFKKVAVDDFCKEFAEDGVPAFTGKSEKIKYLGIDRHYFIQAITPKIDKLDYQVTRSSERSGDGCPIAIHISQAQGTIAPGDSVSIQMGAYLGPKEVSFMGAHSRDLESSLDLGWFGVVGQPLLHSLKAINSLVGNFGIAIIIVTILLKLLFFPLNQAAAVSMKKMQKLQPQMQSLREKYKDDPRRQQQELMKFMSTNKINPAKGCLPILPQIPVFIAFYNVLSHAIELRHAPFYGWLSDLAAADPYYVTPVLLGAGMFIQQKLTPNPSMDKAQERIMLMMPIIFTAMFFSLPAGMVLYMITNTIVSIAQQQWINHRLN
jgi:YidC/Oxa1 family membrane protein insertase